MGDAPNQWPYSFDVAPEAMPVVVKVQSFAQCPTAVSTTANVYRPNNFVDVNDQDRLRDPRAGFLVHALVATEEGTLHTYALGGLKDDTAADPNAIVESGTIAVGRTRTAISPLGLAGGMFDHPRDYVVSSRGDRRIDFLRGADGTGLLSTWKTLRDSRLVDPVSVIDVIQFGNGVPLVAVADYAGRQLVEYRYDQIALPFYGNQTFGMGPSGQDEFECGGAYATPGGVLFSSNANIP